MNKFNSVVLQGRVAFEPEVKELRNGSNLGKFRMSCKAERGMLFIDVDVWEKDLLTIVRRMKKSDEIKITGELRSSSWETPEGEKRNRISVVADGINISQQPDDNRQNNRQDDNRQGDNRNPDSEMYPY